MDEASKNESSPRPFYFFNEDKMEASQVLEANLFNVGFFFYSTRLLMLLLRKMHFQIVHHAQIKV